mmetsp:Transcript_168199/g.540367  ORF Transcript_168199/g.540367 Transcript_168199/m.540367 type:complete len:981 (+) Transcript_168199:77-3019(+)
MDIVLTHADNLSDKSYISIRAGDVRKQLQYKAGQELHFDFKGAQVNTVPKYLVVDVFEKVGSAQVRIADLATKADGADLDFQSTVSIPNVGGNTIKLDMHLQTKDGCSGSNARPVSKLSRHQAALDARNYLEGNGVQKMLQDMVHEVLADRPADPVGFMISYLGRFQGQLHQSQDCTQVSTTFDVQKSEAVPDNQGLVDDDDDVVQSLPDLSQHHSLVAMFLRREPALYQRLRHVRTPLGTSLGRCIQAGVENKGHPMIKFMGLVAGDEFCYEVFKEVFEPVLSQWYGTSATSTVCLTTLATSPLEVAAMDSTAASHRVVSVEACASRNLTGIRMLPHATIEELRRVESLVRSACESLQGDLSGQYLPLCNASSDLSLELVCELTSLGLLFYEPDSLLSRVAGFNRHWPEARGIFLTNDKLTAVWVNEGDHLKITSKRQGQDLSAVVHRVACMESQLRQVLRRSNVDFAVSESWGYLTADPSNLGVEASATLQLPCLGDQESTLKSRCKELGLNPQVRVSASAGKAEAQLSWNIRCRSTFGKAYSAHIENLVSGCQQLLALDSILHSDMRVDEPDQSHAHSGMSAIVPCSGVPSDVCPDQMPDLSQNHSLAAQVMRSDPSIYARLRAAHTSSGTSFASCVKTCFDNKGHPMIKTVGLVAGDESCYDVFRDMFDPVIRLRHPQFDGSTDHFSEMDLEQVSDTLLDRSAADRAVSVCVRISRNLRDLRMPPACSLEQRREVETLVAQALTTLPDDLQGKYYPLVGSTSHPPLPNGMSEAEEHQLRDEQLLFDEPDSHVLSAAGFCRDWPDARGVFVDAMHTTVMWVNEVDHIRMAVMQSGGDLKSAYGRLCKLHDGLEASLETTGHGYARSARLGYLGSCPSRLGTCLDVCMTLRIPLVSRLPEFRALCRKLKLQAHMAIGPHVSTQEGIWEVMSSERLGTTEVSQVNGVMAGCGVLLDCEDRLDRGETIDFEGRVPTPPLA